MTLTTRDIAFVGVNAVIGLLIGYAVSTGALSHDAALSPLMLIFVCMAAIELIAGYVLKIPLGQFVGMPVRVAALIVSFAASMLAPAL